LTANDRCRPPRRAPWGLAGALGLILLAESWVAAHRLDFTGFLAAFCRYSADAVRQAPGCAVLCLGDSLVKHGVVPRVLAERHGPALNLARNGAQPAFTYFLFRRALDAGARPSAVVVDFQSTQLQADPSCDFAGLAEVLGAREAFDHAREGRDPALFGRLVAAHYLPSLRARDGLRNAVLGRLGGKPGVLQGEALRTIFRRWDADGGVHLERVATPIGADGLYWDERLLGTLGPWRLHPTNARYLHRFLRLAAERRIPVYWVIPPVRRRLQAEFDRRCDSAGYTALLRRVEAAYPNLTVVDARGAGYPDDDFLDGSHLLERGALRFSRQLAAVVETRGGPATRPRWVVLGSPTPDGPPPPALADRPGPSGEATRRR
jgi:hypothetical protein